MAQDHLNEMEDQQTSKGLPTTLNVITILTFIGCALSALYTFSMKSLNGWFAGEMQKQLDKGSLSEKKAEEVQRALDLMAKNNEHFVPILITSLVCVALCFVGALWMRKLKKDGYWLYVVGELAPLIVYPLIVGVNPYTDLKSMVGLIFPLAFVALYTSQRKHLVN